MVFIKRKAYIAEILKPQGFLFVLLSFALRPSKVLSSWLTATRLFYLLF